MISNEVLEKIFSKKLLSDSEWEYEDNQVSILKDDVKDNGSLSFTIKVNDKKEKFDVALVVKPDFSHVLGFCTCADANMTGVCKHMVMGCLEVNELLKTQAEQSTNKLTDVYKLDLLKDIYAPHSSHDVIKVFLHLKDLTDTGIAVGLKASILGNKPYVVKNIDTFLKDIDMHNKITLGRGFDSANYLLDENSQLLVNQLMLINHELNISGKNLNNSLINFEQLARLVKLQINQEIFFMGEEYLIKQRIDDIVMKVDYLKEDEYKVSLKKASFFEKLNHQLIINRANKIIYYVDDKELNKVNLLDSFDEAEREFVVNGEYAQEFMQDIIPNIYNDFDVKFDKRFDLKIIDDVFSASLFCYLENRVIKIKVNFKYGNQDINKLDKNVLVKRNYIKENSTIQGLINQGYSYNPEDELFFIEASKMQFYFLTKSIFSLKQDYEVFLDEKLQNAILTFDSSSISVDIKNSDDQDYFDVSFDLPEIDKKEIQDIINSINEKKEFHKLSNDTFIRLNDSNLLAQLLFIKEVIGDSSYKVNDYRQPKYKSYLLKNKAASLFSNVTYSKEFNDYIDKITLIEDLDQSVFEVDNYKLRDYQKQGVNLLSTLYKSSLGALLADEMGLGKTLQVISFFDVNNISNALIVVPKALLYNWRQEFMRFSPNQQVVILDGNKPERDNLVRQLTKNQIVLISYSTLINDYELFDGYDFDCVVIDEAQYIKNPATKTARTTKKISADFFIALTGTPIENNLLELWSIFDFIIPGYLSDINTFKSNYLSNKVNQQKQIDSLKSAIDPFILRRNKKDVLKEIPDKIINDIYCEMEDYQKVLYKEYLDQVVKESIKNSTTMDIIAQITRLRQISIDPKLVMPAYDKVPGKLQVFDEIISEIVASDEKVLVFSQYTTVLKGLAAHLDESGTKYYYLDGETKPKRRMEDVERFNKNKTPVYLISLKAGGVGLNLTSASKVIIYDPWWNPAVEAQAIDRTHRLGQSKKVQVFRFLSINSIEEKIHLMNQSKLDVSNAVLDSKISYLNHLSSDELIGLLTSE